MLSIVSFLILPPRVAIHFGVNGMAGGWGPNYSNALIFLVTNVFFFFTIWLSPRLIFMLSPKWINLPNKGYWLRAENKAQTNAKLSSLMWEFGTAFFLFFFIAELLVIQANLSQPVKLDQKLFLSALIVFLIYSVYWCIRLYRDFRLPRETSGSKSTIGF
jgi:hypothetical protein